MSTKEDEMTGDDASAGQVRGSSIEIPTTDGPMPAYQSVPAGQARGAVMVFQEAFGLTTYIERVADDLAAEGWQAVAPALFHRQGAPVLSYADMDAIGPIMGQLTAEGLAMDIEATVGHLESGGFPVPRIGAVGFCLGGSVAFLAATLRPLGAAVTFYGGGVTQGRCGIPALVDLVPALRTPWLGCYGDLDKGIPVEQVEQLVSAAAHAPVPAEIVRYPDADHGFHCDARPAVYHQASAADAWARALDWLARHADTGAAGAPPPRP